MCDFLVIYHCSLQHIYKTFVPYVKFVYLHFSLLPYMDFPKEYVLLFQPFSHIYGSGMTVISLVAGRRAILMKQFTLDGYVKLVSKYRVCLFANC